MENKKYGEPRMGKDDKEPMDNISKTLLVVFIVIFVIAIIVVKVFI